MISYIKRMWQAAPAATVILAVALAASVFFGVRTASSWVYWSDPRHIDQPIAGWMTPRYVALSWDVPRAVMLEALGEVQPGGGRNLAWLAEQRGMTLEALIAEIEATIAAHRAGATGGGGT